MKNDNPHDMVEHRDDEEKKVEVNESKQDCQVLSINLSACERDGVFIACESKDMFKNIMSQTQQNRLFFGKDFAPALAQDFQSQICFIA